MSEPTAPSPETVEKVKRLVERIVNAKGTARAAAAEQELYELRHEGVLALHELSKPRSITDPEARSRVTPALIAGNVAAVLTVAFVLWAFDFHISGVMILGAIATLLSLSIGARLLFRRIRSRRPQMVVPGSVIFQAVLRLDDPCFFPFMNRMPVRPDDLQQEVMKAFIRTQPMLRARDACLFQQSRGINEALSRFSNPFTKNKMTDAVADYVVALLKALPLIGDPSSLPHVKRLAQSATNPRVRDAARECLPLFQERIGAQAQMLLHPSSAPEPTSEELLRAAANADESAPDQLLRADGRVGKDG